jgi:hypothetical protein
LLRRARRSELTLELAFKPRTGRTVVRRATATPLR